MRRLLSLSALSLLCACATGPVFNGLEPIPEGAARVYLYRPFAIAAANLAPSFDVDDNMMSAGTVSNGSYLSFIISASQQKILGSDKNVLCAPRPLILHPVSGKSYFIEVEVGERRTGDRIVPWQFSCDLIERDQSEALPVLRKLHRAQCQIPDLCARLM